eukprot:1180618-Prorocentrum_minimum.AAC.1
MGELEPCACSFHQDVQCEYGFERRLTSTSYDVVEACVAAGSREDAFAKCYLDVGDFDYRETGERLVNGDACVEPGEPRTVNEKIKIKCFLHARRVRAARANRRHTLRWMGSLA